MNSSLPKITIIIATYNSERTIKLCLKSCLSQDYLNKEIIVADGKSTDKTIKIVKNCGHNDIDVSSGIILPINSLLNDMYGECRKQNTPPNTYMCPTPEDTSPNTVSSAANNTFIKNGIMVTCSFIESSCALTSAFFSSLQGVSCASTEKEKQS